MTSWWQNIACHVTFVLEFEFWIISLGYYFYILVKCHWLVHGIKYQVVLPDMLAFILSIIYIVISLDVTVGSNALRNIFSMDIWMFSKCPKLPKRNSSRRNLMPKNIKVEITIIWIFDGWAYGKLVYNEFEGHDDDMTKNFYLCFVSP